MFLETFLSDIDRLLIWVLLLLSPVLGLIWYFRKRRKSEQKSEAGEWHDGWFLARRGREDGINGRSGGRDDGHVGSRDDYGHGGDGDGGGD